MFNWFKKEEKPLARKWVEELCNSLDSNPSLYEALSMTTSCDRSGLYCIQAFVRNGVSVRLHVGTKQLWTLGYTKGPYITVSIGGEDAPDLTQDEKILIWKSAINLIEQKEKDAFKKQLDKLALPIVKDTTYSTKEGK